MCRGIGTMRPGSEHMEAINARRQTCRDNSSTDTHTQKRMKHHQQRWWWELNDTNLLTENGNLYFSEAIYDFQTAQLLVKCEEN